MSCCISFPLYRTQDDKDFYEIKVAGCGVKRRIYLIRHGDYIRNRYDRLQHLTSGGRAQAKATSLYLKVVGVKPTHITVSSLTRARETAEPIIEEFSDAAHAPMVEVMDDLREITVSDQQIQVCRVVSLQ